MPRLSESEVYRKIKPVDLAPVLAIVDRLPFVSVNQGRADKYPCDVVLKVQFPPELVALMYGLDLGGYLARAVVRRLAPRQSIPPHTDQWMPGETDWRRFQVPIVTHPDIIMRWPEDDVSVHLEPGWLYEVRYNRTHEVIHGADYHRLHLQIDQVDATI